MKPILELQLGYEKSPEDIHKEIHILVNISKLGCWLRNINNNWYVVGFN